MVALGEGLETQFWRVGERRGAAWVSVDGAETIALRERLLPASPRLRAVTGSALGLAWAEPVDPGAPVIVTAQGLLMYLEPADVHGLIAGIARRLPGARLVFDAVPAWLAARSRAGKLVTGERVRAAAVALGPGRRGGAASPSSRRSSPSPCRLCAGSPPPAGSVGSGW